MAKAKAWEVTDEFWSRVEPLIPLRQRVAQPIPKTAGAIWKAWPQISGAQLFGRIHRRIQQDQVEHKHCLRISS